MLIIIHRLRTIFYYLPFFHAVLAIAMRNAFPCASVDARLERQFFSENDKSYEMYIMSLRFFFLVSSTKRKQTLREKMEFSCSMEWRELHGALGMANRSRGRKIYRPRLRPREEIKMQIHAVSLWRLMLTPYSRPSPPNAEA